MDIQKIREKAVTFLNSDNEKEKLLAKMEVEQYFKQLQYTSKNKATKETGLSYLGSTVSNTKMRKSKKSNYNSYILHLLPANKSGYNICPKASIGCKSACLNTSGRARVNYNTIMSSRLLKTWLFFANREYFMQFLIDEIESAINKSKKYNKKLSVRLNGTSDLMMEQFKINNKNILQLFPNIEFYDYTKIYKKLEKNNYSNYHLTFSFSGDNMNECFKALENGYQVAVPFLIGEKEDLPQTFMGYEVCDADKDDLRFLDSKQIAGLRIKKPKNKESENLAIESGFFVDPKQYEIKEVA